MKTELQAIRHAMAKNAVFTFALAIGAGFEFLNHRTLMLTFMEALYKEQSFLSQLAAVFGAMFLVTSIVGTGLRRKVWVSWGLAIITTVVSFAVYAKVWTSGEVSSINLAIVIFSALLPVLVAYFTHEIGRDVESTTDDENEQLRATLVKQWQRRQIEAEFAGLLTTNNAPAILAKSEQVVGDTPQPKAEPIVERRIGFVPTPKESKAPTMRTCQHCGQSYTYRHHKQKFCSDNCRYEFHNEKKS